MSESAPDQFEEGPEHIPTSEEVLEVFKQLIGETEFAEIQKLEDERGLYLWEIKISAEDGHTEYAYSIRVRPGATEPPGPRIDVVFCDTEGVQISGSSVAKYINGQWRITP